MYNDSTLLNHCAFSASGKYTCKRKYSPRLIVGLIYITYNNLVYLISQTCQFSDACKEELANNDISVHY